jgi:hypothetical protein
MPTSDEATTAVAAATASILSFKVAAICLLAATSKDYFGVWREVKMLSSL